MIIYGMTEIAKILGISTSKVKYLWTGRTDKNGNQTAPALNYRLTPTGRRFSTKADINSYLKTTYKTTLL